MTQTTWTGLTWDDLDQHYEARDADYREWEQRNLSQGVVDRDLRPARCVNTEVCIE
jgi:hypothetical protein